MHPEPGFVLVRTPVRGENGEIMYTTEELVPKAQHPDIAEATASASKKNSQRYYLPPDRGPNYRT